MNEAGVPCSIYNAPADLFTHPQLMERGSFTEFEDATSSFFIQNAPFQFASVDISTPPVAPLLGEHTDEILKTKLNLNAGQISALREEAVIR
ncbi:MAG: CoA transferase [Proteobacteria bacterium]|nr:CoA transferase [Pseudomonadota bacterium]